MATATLSARPDRLSPASAISPAPARLSCPVQSAFAPNKSQPWRGPALATTSRRRLVRAGSRADDPVPFGMSVENALKVLGVSEGASFEDILRAKNSIIASSKDDPETIAQVEAAYDMLLMQSLTQRRAGKVVDSGIRYADVKPKNVSRTGSIPRWMQAISNNSLISVEMPSTSNIGLQAGFYGALMVLTYVNGASSSSGTLSAGADVSGLILASSFGASLYFFTKKNVKLGKASVITIGGLAAGAVMGSAVENWLQVDVVPFLGLHSSASVVSEFILFSQLLASLYLR